MLPYIDADAVFALPWREAIDALHEALEGTPAGVPRSSVAAPGGELLLMPASSGRAVGIKLVGVAAGNPARGLARINAVYVLFDAQTLVPTALLDGTALTTLRTPAVSALAIERLARPGAGSLVVFGAGPQAEAHVAAVRAVRPVTRVRIVGRDRGRAEALAERLASGGADVAAGRVDDVGDADIVVTATTAREPLFDAGCVAPDACVVAVGSHEPASRELPGALFARAARVVVEDRATALREAGDVLMAIAEGHLREDRLLDLADLPALSPGSGVSVVKTVGMGWQDLAVASAVLAGRGAQPRRNNRG